MRCVGGLCRPRKSANKKKNIDIDQYYVFKYNQQFRLEHQEYYRNYCKEYNEWKKEQLQSYRKGYYKNKTLLNKQESVIDFKEEKTTVLFR